MKRKLNIALVHDNIGNIVDGAITSTCRFAEHLKNRGHNVIFISGKKPKQKEDHEEMHNGIKTYRFNSIAIKQNKRLFFVSFPPVKKLQEIFLREKIDVVHIMIPVPSALRCVKAAKKLGIDIVAHSHTQPENILFYLPKRLRLKSINQAIYKYLIWFYKKANVVICPSKFAERLLKKQNPKLNTQVISNGVNLDRFKKISSKTFINRYHLSNEKKRILFVGRIDPEKSLETLIKAMPKVLKSYKKAHLDIIGSGILHEEMMNLVRELNLEDNVTFYGRLPDKQLVSGYNSADLFVLPSFVELEGMVVLEAMACGKPIIIANSNQSASVDFVNENGFLFEPGNSSDLAEKITKLLTDEKLMKKMGNKSREISKEYDISKSVDKLEKTYYQLL